MTNNEKLADAMGEHNLSRKDVASITFRSLFAVISWLRPTDDPGYRAMPDSAWALIDQHIEKHNAVP